MIPSNLPPLPTILGHYPNIFSLYMPHLVSCTMPDALCSYSFQSCYTIKGLMYGDVFLTVYKLVPAEKLFDPLAYETLM